MTQSIYGLKQSPRKWNAELHAVLISLGLIQSKHDPTLYYRLQDEKLVGAITVHVGNIAVVGESACVTSFIINISSRFNISSDEYLHHFLSLDIQRNIGTQDIYLSQQHYIQDVP